MHFIVIEVQSHYNLFVPFFSTKMQYRKNIKNLIGQLAVNTKPAHKNGEKKKKGTKQFALDL